MESVAVIPRWITDKSYEAEANDVAPDSSTFKEGSGD